MAKLKKGKFEVPLRDFSTHADKNDVYVIDLKETVPELFAKSFDIPEVFKKIWRVVIDDTIGTSGGIYACDTGTKISIIFSNIPSAKAIKKTEHMKSLIQEIVRSNNIEVGLGEIMTDAPSDENPAMEKSAAIERAYKEKLKDNPSISEVKAWAVRTANNINHSEQSHPMIPELVILPSQANVEFLPMWSTKRQIFNSNFCNIASDIAGKSLKDGGKGQI